MDTYTQENRMIQIQTPLGKDVLLLQGFTGQEGISRLFQFDLKMHSENRSISFDAIVGKKATIKMVLADRSERYINGIISSFAQGGSSLTFAHYHATLVPWLWLLTRTSDCRIFQNKSVPDIIQKIFKEYGFSDFKNKLHGNFEPREYCVQYRETDFNFISRLMEEEGIFYFFEHEKDKHTLVLANQPNAFKPCPHQPKARYQALEGVGRTEEVVSEWSIGQEVRPGKYEVRDFNFKQPSLDLTAGVTGHDQRKYEIYDYPGEYSSRDGGERLVGIRMQEEDTGCIVVTGSSTCRAFTSGYRFDLKEHYRDDLNKAYAITSVYHSVDQGTNYHSLNGNAGEGFEYMNRFQCVPHPTPFRPPRKTPVPVVHGTQTAIVVGPAGEEIYVDKFGRVKVQFHWDREGKRDEHSSCWIRVSQPWAGKSWGGVSIPRIGQEVIIDFLEGDPDQPIIVGRVYNAEAMPPYPFPAGGVISGMKSNSTKGGGGYNEFSMNDTKGKEKITIHGQYDMNTTVEHDQTTTVHNNRTDKIDVDDSETVGGNQTWSVGKNRTATVGINDSETVGGNQTLSVSGARTRTVSKSESVTVSLTRTHSVGINEMINVGAAQQINVGGAQTITVGGVQAISAGGAQAISAGAAQVIVAGGKQAIMVKGGQTVSVATKRGTSVGADDSLKVGAKLTVTAGSEIALKSGGASIVMKSDGTIVIKGNNITIDGKNVSIKSSGKISAKAGGDMVLKGAKIGEN